jgi:NAD(P)-dependent dehydrogenase (short-subunit alcohol dehydrogenase family)
VIASSSFGGPVAPLIDIEPSEWDSVFASNVRSIYLMCRAFLPAMIEGGAGDIVNLASVTGLTMSSPTPGLRAQYQRR